MEFFSYTKGRAADVATLVCGFYGGSEGCPFSQKKVNGRNRPLSKIIYIGNESDFREICKGGTIRAIKNSWLLDEMGAIKHGKATESLAIKHYVANPQRFSMTELFKDSEVRKNIGFAVSYDRRLRDKEVLGEDCMKIFNTYAIVAEESIIRTILQYLTRLDYDECIKKGNAVSDVIDAGSTFGAIGFSVLCVGMPKHCKNVKPVESGEDE